MQVLVLYITIIYKTRQYTLIVGEPFTKCRKTKRKSGKPIYNEKSCLLNLLYDQLCHHCSCYPPYVDNMISYSINSGCSLVSIAKQIDIVLEHIFFIFLKFLPDLAHLPNMPYVLQNILNSLNGLIANYAQWRVIVNSFTKLP